MDGPTIGALTVRDQVVIATRFGFRIEHGSVVGLNSRPEQIRSVANASLKRLGVERLDLFYQHPRRYRAASGFRRPVRAPSAVPTRSTR
ncbi:aldo/keto reductase [Streptomyces sp. NPDC001537]